MDKVSADIPDLTQQDLVSLYYRATQEAVDFVQTQIVPVLSGQLHLSKKEEAILGTFYRIHALASSLTRLNKKSDFNAVAVIARTIFELLLDLKTLAAEELSAEELDRFHAFAEVDRFRKASKLLEFECKNPVIESSSKLDSKIRKQFVESSGKQSEIEARVEQLWGRTKGKLNWPINWLGVGIKERAKKFGPRYEREYLEIYTFLSSYVHSGNAAYTGFSEDTLEAVYGFFQNLSREVYIEALILCAKTFSLNKVIEGFPQVVNFLKDAPRQIFIHSSLGSLNQTT